MQKRRVYDITTVMEGIGVVEKICKNKVRWRARVQEQTLSEKGEGSFGDCGGGEQIQKELDMVNQVIA